MIKTLHGIRIDSIDIANLRQQLKEGEVLKLHGLSLPLEMVAAMLDEIERTRDEKSTINRIIAERPSMCFYCSQDNSELPYKECQCKKIRIWVGRCTDLQKHVNRLMIRERNTDD